LSQGTQLPKSLSEIVEEQKLLRAEGGDFMGLSLNYNLDGARTFVAAQGLLVSQFKL
jgi:hypothetical protein